MYIKPIDMKPLHGLLLCCLTILLTNCNNGSPEKDAAALSDSISVTGLTGEAVKLVKTADLHFRVKAIEHSTRQVSQLAMQLGGMVFHHNLQFREGGRNELKVAADSLLVISVFHPEADITVRVPAQNLEAFMNRVTGLGYFTSSSNLQIDDRSLAYLENVMKQQNRASVLAAGHTGKIKPLTGLQAIHVNDAAIAQEVENYSIDALARYSTVTLHLTQHPLIMKEIIANPAIGDYQLPFSQRLEQALAEGWQYFIALMLALAHLWMFILLGLMMYLSYRHLQQKRKLAAPLKV